MCIAASVQPLRLTPCGSAAEHGNCTTFHAHVVAGHFREDAGAQYLDAARGRWTLGCRCCLSESSRRARVASGELRVARASRLAHVALFVLLHCAVCKGSLLVSDGPGVRLQAWVFFITWVQYAANHVTRKCYTNVKNIMIEKGLKKTILGRMDAGFMFTYAFGAPFAGQLGDMFNPAKVLGIGLYGSALCIFLLATGIWENVAVLFNPILVNFYFLAVYLIFGFFQAIGGPVGTSIMGNWMVTPGARKNRGLIYGLWTTHQYFGNIIAPVIIIFCNMAGAAWWWGLMWPVLINASWGAICYYFLPPFPSTGPPAPTTALNTVPEEPPARSPISIRAALAIPSVPGYCIAFGFMCVCVACYGQSCTAFRTSPIRPAGKQLTTSSSSGCPCSYSVTSPRTRPT